MAAPSHFTPSPLMNPKITYLPTIAAYNRWAPTYDHDRNPLQALDDLQLSTLLPTFLSLTPSLQASPTPLTVSPAPSSHSATTTTVIDLGCGTGRNTLKLLSIPGIRVVGLDASKQMLEIARHRCTEHWRSLPVECRAHRVEFAVFDMLDPTNPGGLGGVGTSVASAVVSTLVLEHVPLEAFFTVAARLVASGGVLLVTNMHAEMGARTRAGFVDAKTGEKIRGVSYVHVIEDVVSVAGRYGFGVVGEVRERAVESDDMERLGSRAEKWIGVRCWFGVVFEKVGGTGGCEGGVSAV